MKLVESDAQKQQEAMRAEIVEASELLWSAKRERREQEQMKEAGFSAYQQTR